MSKNEPSYIKTKNSKTSHDITLKNNQTTDNSKIHSAIHHGLPFSTKKPIDQENTNSALSQEIYDEYIQLRTEFIEHRDRYDNQACINVGIQLNSTAILLTEIYEFDPQYYYEALILTTSAYRKCKNYDMAEMNLKKMKNGLKKIIESQKQENQVLYNYYIMCLKEFVILYVSMQNFNLAIKFEELLLGEDQEFFQDEDVSELKLAKAIILKTSHRFDEAINILEGIKESNIESLSSLLAVNVLTELSFIYNAKGNVESAVYEINSALDLLKNTGLGNSEIKRTYIETYNTKLNYLTEFVKKFDINNQDCDFDEESTELKTDIINTYSELTNFILSELQSKENLIEENLYINPIHKYILYLGKTKDFKKAINLCDDVLMVLKRFYSNFNKYVGYTYELKARLLAKKHDIGKAKENYQAAYDIFYNLNDRSKSAQIKKSLDKLNKN